MMVGDFIPYHDSALLDVFDYGIQTVGVVLWNLPNVPTRNENQLELYDETYMIIARVPFPEETVLIAKERPC